MINLADKIKNIKILNQPELNNKKTILMAFLVSAIILYIDVNLVFKAQIKGFNKSGLEITRLTKDLDNLKIEAKKIRELESKQPLPKTGLKAKRIISESQFSSLLQDISKSAINNQVRILQIKPSRKAASASQENKSRVPDKFTPVLISLELSGGYHNLGKFINGLENLESFVKVQEIKIEPQENDPLNQKISLSLVTYVK